jgi:hypothetical protein
MEMLVYRISAAEKTENQSGAYREVNMTRKNFLVTGLLGSFGALVALVQSRCSSSTTPPPPTTSKTFTSTSVNAHTHSITIDKSEVQTPGAGGISRQTSSTGHTHTFAMTQMELMTCNSGAFVVVTTSVTDLHQHTFTISKWF